jgi:hypothetical protein
MSSVSITRRRPLSGLESTPVLQLFRAGFAQQKTSSANLIAFPIRVVMDDTLGVRHCVTMVRKSQPTSDSESSESEWEPLTSAESQGTEPLLCNRLAESAVTALQQISPECDLHQFISHTC